MADTKISNLTGLAAAPNEDDVFALVDTSASSTKKLEAKYLVRDSGGSGAIVTGAFTLTLQQSMQAAGRNVANTFTAENVFAEVIRPQKGIAFPVIQVESADAHTLDDYEEGVFYLEVAMSTSGTVTLDNKTCRYTKIGRAITISGFITVTSVSSPVGTVQFTGLPYPSGGGWTAVSLQDNLSGKTKAYIPPSVSYIEYSYFDDGVISAGMSPSWHCIILSTYTV